MSAPDYLRAQIAELERRAAEARRWAAEASARAERLEQGSWSVPAIRQASAGSAAMHRRIRERLLASASLQDQYADRLRAGLERAGRPGRQSAFMAAVAAAIGVPSATVVLLGGSRSAAVVASSDDTARAAHDLEFVLGEGPAQAAAASGRPVEAVGEALCDRWPRYGPAVARLGVLSVHAAPLQPPTSLGAVCAYGTRTALSDQTLRAASVIADALSLTLSQAGPGSHADDVFAALTSPGGHDTAAVIHQAAGMVSAHGRCGIDDALALLRARAFSAGRPAEEIAASILRGELRLC